MKNVIYIPLPENNNPLLKEREKVAKELILGGWNYSGKIDLYDGFGEKVTAIVLDKEIQL